MSHIYIQLCDVSWYKSASFTIVTWNSGPFLVSVFLYATYFVGKFMGLIYVAL